MDSAPLFRYHDDSFGDQNDSADRSLSSASGNASLEVIRSPQNATIRRLAALRNHRRRRASGSLLVDGPRETLRALEAGIHLLGFYEPWSDSEGWSTGPPELQLVRERAQDLGRHHAVSAQAFAKIKYGGGSDRCVAEMKVPSRTFDDLPNPPRGLVLVLDGVEKPGNVGAVFRTADAAGVDAVMLSDCPCDVWNPNAVRASLGAVFTVPHATGTADQVADRLLQWRIPVLAMRVEAADSLYECELDNQAAVILGSEAGGLNDRWTQIGGGTIGGIMLPMLGQIDSLNVSVSAAVVAYEALRQRLSAELPPPPS